MNRLGFDAALFAGSVLVGAALAMWARVAMWALRDAGWLMWAVARGVAS